MDANREPPVWDPNTPGREHLYPDEQFWVKVQPFLLSRGYQLRPRYHPEWIPSWTVQRSSDGKYEDRLASFHKRVLDATRIQDGKKVVLKRVLTDGTEIGFFKFLDSRRDDPRNRTIPVLDIVCMPDSPWSFIVTPYCRKFDHPPFHCRNEFLEAMTQFIQGLQFMHDHNTAHFDIAPQNLVMDETKVVPLGSHFCNEESHSGFSRRWFGWNIRCSVGPVDYYYIDFGLSLYFPDGKDTATTTGTLRTFPNIPELSLKKPYNPFLVDIFQLGLTMHKLIDDYVDLEVFRPVADSMTAPDPTSRPSADDALAHLRAIAATIPPAKLAEQIWKKDLSLWQKVSISFRGGYTQD